MAEIAALGLAANLVQFVGFALQATTVCTEIYQEGRSKHHQDIRARSIGLEGITKEFVAKLHSYQTCTAPTLGKDEQDLIHLAESCESTAKQLQDALDKLYNGSRFRRMTRVATSKLRSSDSIASIQSQLNDHQKTLDTRILVSLRAAAQEIFENQRSKFQRLEDELKIFIRKLDEGITQTNELVKRESEITRTHVTREHETTRKAVVNQAKKHGRRIENEALAVRGHISVEHNKSRELSAQSFSKMDQLIRAEAGHTRDQFAKHKTELEGRLASDAIGAKCRELVDSLVFPSMHAREDQIDAAYEQTYEFIFDESDGLQQWSNFVEWLRSGTDVYWINGKAGAGKSTLMRFIYDDHRTKSHLAADLEDVVEEPVIVGFFFWNAGDSLQKSSRGMLRSILYQMLDPYPDICARVLNADASLQRRPLNLEWSTRALLHLLDIVLEHFTSPLTVFLDGLDEFDEDLDNLLRIIDGFRTSATTSARKLCVSSRPLTKLQAYFKSCAQLKLQDLTEPSIRNYVNGWLGEHVHESRPEFKTYLTHLEHIAEEITLHANGIFLWAKLAVSNIVESINNRDSLVKLFTVLNDLPPELDDMYHRMWNKIRRWYQNEARLYFNIVLCSELSLLQFLLATDDEFEHVRELKSFTLDEDTLLRKCDDLWTQIVVRCAGLLEVTDRASKEDYVVGDGFEPFSGEENLSNPLSRLHRCTTVTFIHKTAIDFVRAQLSEDSSQGERGAGDHYALRLVGSRFALFLLDHNLPVIDIEEELEIIENTASSTAIVKGEYGSEGQPRMKEQTSFLYHAVDLLESLSRQGAIQGLHVDFWAYDAATDVLGALLERHRIFLDVALRKILEQPNATREYLAYLLRCSCFGDQDTNHKITLLLLQMGADPMSRDVEPIETSDRIVSRVAAWHWYLTNLIQESRGQDDPLPDTRVSLEVAEFVRRGADLSLPMAVGIIVSPDGSLEVLNKYPRGHTYSSLAIIFSVAPSSILQHFFGGRQWLKDLVHEFVPPQVSGELDMVLLAHHYFWYRNSDERISSHTWDKLSSGGGRFGKEDANAQQVQAGYDIYGEALKLCNTASLISYEDPRILAPLPGWTEETMSQLLAMFTDYTRGVGEVIRNSRLPKAILESVPGDVYRNLPDELFEYLDSEIDSTTFNSDM